MPDSGHGLIDNAASPADRIHRADLLPSLLRWSASECGLGPVLDYRISDVGYDDCNVILATGSGRYLVKIFTVLRSAGLSRRYVDIIESAIGAGVHHPRLLRGRGGTTLLRHPGSGNLLLVMDFVDGATFLELGTWPDPGEMLVLTEQLHRIHRIDLCPQFVHDWWAIPNIGRLAAEIGPALAPATRRLVTAAVRRFCEVDVGALPHVLAHGDLTKANTMRVNSGGIAILDFAVANRYPRVHDLAMVLVNLMHGHPTSIPERIELMADLYGEHDPLNATERVALPKYAFAAAAMEFLGATREWVLKKNHSDETRFLLGLGETALEAARC
jgi:Ser/Thr protein kinase RdoA (MazF antagonist)